VVTRANTSSTRPATAATLFSCVLVLLKALLYFIKFFLSKTVLMRRQPLTILSEFDSPLA
jgi:hypothetical protein